MALLEFSYQSDILGFEQELCVLLPDPRVYELDKKGCADPEDLSVLYLLNGYQGNHLDFVRNTMLPRFLKESRKKLAVVMPAGLTYYYADMKRGWKYFTYVAEEVPRIVQSYLHISPKRENTFVGGTSMGGLGALKLALTYPERYAMACSISGVTDPVLRSVQAVQERPELAELFNNIYGEDVEARKHSADDLMELLEKTAASGKPLPRLCQSIGTADYLYDMNVAFRGKARALGYDLDYYEEEGVGHEWRFWNREIEKLIARIPAKPL